MIIGMGSNKVSYALFINPIKPLVLVGFLLEQRDSFSILKNLGLA